MHSFTYMATFGYIPKAIHIKNPGMVENVISKKLSKLAQTGKMVSNDSNVRNSALNSYGALKDTSRSIAKSNGYRKYK